MAERLGEGNNFFNLEFDRECQKCKYKTKHTTGQKSGSFGHWKIWIGGAKQTSRGILRNIRKKDGEDNERDIFRVLLLSTDT